MSKLPGVLLVASLVFPVGCMSSGNGDSTADMIPDVDGIAVAWPTFTSDRPDPVEGELYIVGELLTPQILLIHLEMIYPASLGFPFYMVVRLTMPTPALQATAVEPSSMWPEFAIGTPVADLRTEAPGVWSVWLSIDPPDRQRCRSESSWPSLPSDRVMRFATVTVAIKESGTHTIGVEKFYPQFLIGECSANINFLPPMFGGVLEVP